MCLTALSSQRSGKFPPKPAELSCDMAAKRSGAQIHRIILTNEMQARGVKGILPLCLLHLNLLHPHIYIYAGVRIELLAIFTSTDRERERGGRMEGKDLGRESNVKNI